MNVKKKWKLYFKFEDDNTREVKKLEKLKKAD